MHDPNEGLTPDEIAALDKWEAKRDRRLAADDSAAYRMLAKLGKYYGWGAVEAVLKNRLDPVTMINLVRAGDELNAEESVSRLRDNAEGIGIAFDKHGQQAFRKAARLRTGRD